MPPVTRTFSRQYIAQNADGSITTCYLAGRAGPGAQAELQIASGPKDDYTLSYLVRFPVGFQWVLGGKLPGLCGGQCWTGANNGPGGFTMRLMWRANGVGEVLLSDAVTTATGTDLGRGTSFTFSADDQWHSLSEQVHLNTPGLTDGFITVTYDGVAYTFTGLEIRTDSTQINGLMFCTFYGGGGPSSSPTTDQKMDYLAFGVS